MQVLKTDKKTSDRMRRVATRNTSIEKSVRKVLHHLGYRFRLNDKNLPGKPDIVLKRLKTVIFVHGCFWHGHKSCLKGRLRPRRNVEFWNERMIRNKARDKKVVGKLNKMGWHVLVIWECELPDLEKKIVNYFED